MNSLAFSLKQVIVFWFYGSFGFEGNIKNAKKGIKSVTELPDVLGFTFVT